jgi:hypothetical protein
MSDGNAKRDVSKNLIFQPSGRDSAPSRSVRSAYLLSGMALFVNERLILSAAFSLFFVCRSSSLFA